MVERGAKKLTKSAGELVSFNFLKTFCIVNNACNRCSSWPPAKTMSGVSDDAMAAVWFSNLLRSC